MQTLLQPLTTEEGARMTEINFLKANGKYADYDYMSTKGQKDIFLIGKQVVQKTM